MCIDATTKLPPENNRDWRRRIRMDDATIERVNEMWAALDLPGKGQAIWR